MICWNIHGCKTIMLCKNLEAISASISDTEHHCCGFCGSVFWEQIYATCLSTFTMGHLRDDVHY